MSHLPLTPLVTHYLRSRYCANLRGSALREYQDRRARKIISYAIARSPFYQRRFAGLRLDDWRAFPPIDKATMMANFDTFTTRGVRREEAMKLALAAETSRDYRPTLDGLTVGLSSGTSGHRGLFVVDEWERAAWSGNLLARVLPGRRLRGYKAILFLRSGSNLYDSLNSGWLKLRYCDLMTPLDEAVAILNAFDPDLLVAPPSLLIMLASQRMAGRLKVAPLKVISVAEVLDPEDEQRIACAFGAPVHQIYQCTEGLMAVTCQRGALHMLEDCVALQCEPVSREQPDRVTPFVTDLWRRTQPIIRYQLNDILVLDNQPCECGNGFQKIARIEGRQDDLFYFERIEGQARPFFPDIMRRIVLLASAEIRDYEIIQERMGQLRIYLEVEEGKSFASVADAVRRSAVRVLEDYGCQAAGIDIISGLPPRRQNEKRRRVRRLS